MTAKDIVLEILNLASLFCIGAIRLIGSHQLPQPLDSSSLKDIAVIRILAITKNHFRRNHIQLAPALVVPGISIVFQRHGFLSFHISDNNIGGIHHFDGSQSIIARLIHPAHAGTPVRSIIAHGQKVQRMNTQTQITSNLLLVQNLRVSLSESFIVLSAVKSFGNLAKHLTGLTVLVDLQGAASYGKSCRNGDSRPVINIFYQHRVVIYETLHVVVFIGIGRKYCPYTILEFISEESSNRTAIAQSVFHLFFHVFTRLIKTNSLFDDKVFTKSLVERLFSSIPITKEIVHFLTGERASSAIKIQVFPQRVNINSWQLIIQTHLLFTSFSYLVYILYKIFYKKSSKLLCSRQRSFMISYGCRNYRHSCTHVRVRD